MIDIYKTIVEIMNQQGFLISNDADDDFAIDEYLVDSVRFILFFTELEEKIGYELSDDFLDRSLLFSAKGFAEKIGVFIEKQTEKHS